MPDVPPHLRRFVVEQDYAAYTPVDQAVWRFVLLQMHARLMESAHPAYRDGLSSSGISVERIPRVSEMNEKLARFGWGAVCVDGFIPPRAFQEFQASRLLPIAAEIRTREHLVYTPAPDIIHEAAGHAPILPDPVFAAYVQRIGELGKRAFTLPEEDRVYRAVYTLSEVKEDPSRTAEAVAAAESELAAALAAAAEPSEAARLSRLYWWTAEYGLVGTPANYRLYGAGLLSSLGESHSCHAPTIGKIALDESCTDVAFDITRPQPQLFVARDFEHLHEVLDRVARGLAAQSGGRTALERALRSQEVASFSFESGAGAIGVLGAVGPVLSAPAWLELTGPTALSWDGKLLLGHGPEQHPAGALLVSGRLESGEPLHRVGEGALAAFRDGASGRHTLSFESGARISGRLERAQRVDGCLQLLELSDVRAALPGAPPSVQSRMSLLAAGRFVTAHAGASDPRYHPESAPSTQRVPRQRALPAAELALQELYARAERAHHAAGASPAPEFRSILEALDARHRDEWLLRWNLLESLLKRGEDFELAARLRAELEALEAAFEYQQPIASGLRYLVGHVRPEVRRGTLPLGRECP